MFLKVLSHFIMKIKDFMKYFKNGVLKYFKISMKFLIFHRASLTVTGQLPISQFADLTIRG